MKEHDVFLAAIEIDDPGQRAAFLDSACAEDAELRRQVDSLLAAHEYSGEFLNTPVLQQMGGPALRVLGDTRADKGCPAGELDLSFLQPSSRPDSLGRLLHYEIRQFIGRGGCGMVFKAFDEKLERTVAIKVMLPELAATSPARKRFLREARATAAIRHANVIGIHTVEEQPLPFLVMEYIAGETLQQRLDRTGPLDIRDVLQIGRQIASGLAAAHGMKLIHRDIKPSNILLEDGTGHLKVTDFGLARSADDASMTQSGMIAGTPLYMSPEQAQGLSVEHHSDLFSLGSVLYVMCTGRPPFRAPSALAVMKRVVEEQPRAVRDIIPEAPEWLVAIIAKLHAKDPAERFASATEVEAIFARCLAESEQQGGVQLPEDVLALIPPYEKATQKGERETHQGEQQPLHVEPMPATARRLGAPGRNPMIAAFVILAMLGGLGVSDATGITHVGSTVIRLFSPEGLLVVEIDDPGISVSIDGEDIVITGAGAKEIRLKPGQYHVLASKNGEVVQHELVTVSRSGRQVVHIRRESAPAVKVAAPADLETDRKTAEYVLSLGGRVRINDRSDEISDAGGLPKVPFRLTFINLKGNRNLAVSTYETFRDTRNLKGLALDNASNVSDAVLANFRHNKALKFLGTWGADVSAAGLEYFRNCPDLHSIFLGNSRFSDEDMAFFAAFPALHKLTALLLTNCPVTDRGLSHLLEARMLMQLHLDGTRISDEGLQQFHRFSNLRWVLLDRTAISDAGLAHLHSCVTLKTLSLLKTDVTAAGVADLQRAIPHCKVTWDGGVIEPGVAVLHR